jgi:DNA adenine methylase
MPVVKKQRIHTGVTVKPFLKWAGGKRQLLNQFLGMYPPALKTGAIKNYYEPFLGSGAVFFDIAGRYQIENAHLFDINSALVMCYQVIQSDLAKLLEILYNHEKKYLALNKEQRLAYFYEQRQQFNQQGFETSLLKSQGKRIASAAQLIFLNRTCYNGLFRVNSKGEFNTPAGDYTKPVICDSKNLTAVSKVLDKATIQQADFREALNNIRPSSFVYLDPPYRPLSKTASFTAYSKSIFQDEEQAQLAALYRKLDKKGALLMLSNSDTADKFFDKLYRGFIIKRVPARRLINTNASKRGPVNEIVVTNYRPEKG